MKQLLILPACCFYQLCCFYFKPEILLFGLAEIMPSTWTFYAVTSDNIKTIYITSLKVKLWQQSLPGCLKVGIYHKVKWTLLFRYFCTPPLSTRMVVCVCSLAQSEECQGAAGNCNRQQLIHYFHLWVMLERSVNNEKCDVDVLLYPSEIQAITSL